MRVSNAVNHHAHVCVLCPLQSVDGEGERGEGGEVEEGSGELKQEAEVSEEEEEGEFCLSLESLGLGGNKIGDFGAQQLASGLSSNTSESHHVWSS